MVHPTNALFYSYTWHFYANLIEQQKQIRVCECCHKIFDLISISLSGVPFGCDILLTYPFFMAPFFYVQYSTFLQLKANFKKFIFWNSATRSAKTNTVRYTFVTVFSVTWYIGLDFIVIFCSVSLCLHVSVSVLFSFSFVRAHISNICFQMHNRVIILGRWLNWRNRYHIVLLANEYCFLLNRFDNSEWLFRLLKL